MQKFIKINRNTTDWTGKESYYYTGNPDNWISFAGFYWRIMRINGDGTIRVIYQGVADSETPDNGNMSGTGTQIGTSAFNSKNNNNMYVGYMYGSDSIDYDITHDNINNSRIKTKLDTWYSNNLISFANYIDVNMGFCGDRRISSGSGVGQDETTYKSAIRINNNTPSLDCENKDVYTTHESIIGNKALTQPIGLISADEAMFAGIPEIDGNPTNGNKNNYLYTGENYWTISPYNYTNSNGNCVAIIYIGGSIGNYMIINNDAGIRPVINLRSDVEITGSGTTSDPFKVVGA